MLFHYEATSYNKMFQKVVKYSFKSLPIVKILEIKKTSVVKEKDIQAYPFKRSYEKNETHNYKRFLNDWLNFLNRLIINRKTFWCIRIVLGCEQ